MVPAGPGVAQASPGADASAAYEHHDYTQARHIWLSMAQAGDADAAYRLGIMSDLGQGTTEDATEAYHWYRRAAETGYAPAEFNVAVMSDSEPRRAARCRAGSRVVCARRDPRQPPRAVQSRPALQHRRGRAPQPTGGSGAGSTSRRVGGLPAAAEHIEALSTHPGHHWSRRAPACARCIRWRPRSGVALTRKRRRDRLDRAAAGGSGPLLPAGGGARRLRGARELYAAYTDATAALVRVAPGHRSYAWRVFTVSPSTADYSIGPWTSFMLHRRA